MVRVEREREFCAHHLLLGAAYMALESATKREDGWLYHELIAITFSSLALEALANSFGKRLIRRWDHRSSQTDESGDGRWTWVKKEGKFLRVVLLPDGETVHNAFFDSRFEMKGKE